MRIVRNLLRDQRGSESLETGLMLGLIVAGVILVVTWVGDKVYTKLNDLDAATSTTAHQANYKKTKQQSEEQRRQEQQQREQARLREQQRQQQKKK